MKSALSALLLIACAHTEPATQPPVVAKALAQAVLRGNDAYKRKDYEEFLKQAKRASELSPDNPDLEVRVARGLILTGKTAEGLGLLGRILAMGVAYDLDRTDWNSVKDDPAFARCREQVASTLLPRVVGEVAYTLPTPDLIAEAIGWDPVTQAFYVSSVHQRKLLKIDGQGKVTDFVSAETEHWGLLGLQIDSPRRRLWVGAAAMPQVDGFQKADDGLSAILLIDLDKGTVEKRLVADTRGHVFGDLGLAPNGDLWFSDSVGGGVWKVPVDASGLVMVIPPGKLRSPQGIAFAEDGAHAYIADYASGLYRYDVSAGTLERVKLPENTLAYGMDGLARAGNTLLVVQNGAIPHRLARFSLDSSGQTVTRAEIVEKGPALVAPTSGAVVGDDFVYVGVSQWDAFDDDGKQNGDAAVEIRRLKLPR